MKIAITGKGGVGKTTIAALLARTAARKGNRVIAIDADPDANLAALLGHPNPEAIVPLSRHRDLIEERVGSGGIIRLNPRVDDLIDTIATDIEGVKLLVLGSIPKGGGGCFCSPSALLKALMIHLLAQRDEWVILDMEAGLEHLGRGTSAGVDSLVIVLEPSRTSVETALRIHALAGDLGILEIWCIANKTASEEDARLLRDALPAIPMLGSLPRSGGLEGLSVDLAAVEPRITGQIEAIYETLAREGEKRLSKPRLARASAASREASAQSSHRSGRIP